MRKKQNKNYPKKQNPQLYSSFRIGKSDIIGLPILSADKGIIILILKTSVSGKYIIKTWPFFYFSNLVVMPKNEFLEIPGITKK